MKRTQWLKRIPILIIFFSVCQWQPIFGKSFIWKVESKGKYGYILGSIHLLKKEVYPLQSVIEKSFADSDILAVEADVSAKKIVELARLTLEKGMYHGVETLKENLSPKTYSLLLEKLKAYGLEISSFRQFKPWFMAVTLTGVELMRMGFDPNYGIDKYFLEKALKSEKEIVELEGVEFQINLFNSFTGDEQDKFLAGTLIDVEGYKKNIADVVKFWQGGMSAELEQLLNKNIEKYPELAQLNHKIIDQRNQTMTEKIVTYLESSKVHFVVVGAAHLVGEKGILNLLKQKGFQVKQL